MKTAKKALALLLVVALCMGLCATMAFADQTYVDFESERPATIFNVVSIGSDIDGQNDYPYRATKQLQNLYGKGADFRLQVLSQPGLGAAELRAILTRGVSLDDDNASEYTKAKVSEYASTPEALKALGDSYVKTIRGSSINEGALLDIRDKYLLGYDVENDENLLYASFITLDIINSSVTPYLMERVMGIMQNYYTAGKTTLAEVDPYWEDTPAKVHDQAVQGSGRMMDLLLSNTYTELFEAAGLDPEKDAVLIEALTNALSYSAFSFYADFRQVVKYIITANPLAKLVIMGPYNDLAGLQVLVSKDPRINVAFGDFWDSYLAVLGAVICNDENSGYYYYADCMTKREVETCYNDLVEAAAKAAAAGGLTNMSEVDPAYVAALKADLVKMVEESFKGKKVPYDLTVQELLLVMGIQEDILGAVNAFTAAGEAAAAAAAVEGATPKSIAAAAMTEIAKNELAKALVEANVVEVEKMIAARDKARDYVLNAVLEWVKDFDSYISHEEDGINYRYAVKAYAGADKILDSFVQLYGEAAKTPILNINDLATLDLSALSGLIKINETNPLDTELTPPEMTPGLALILNLNARLLAADGMGLTPSEDGVASQTDAMFEACAEIAPANTKGEDATTGVFEGLFGGALKTFQVPVLDAINQAFNNMFANVANWFTNFFANIRNSISGVFNFGK